jgi:23S rRNA (guanosine2251-2'-O)-methyltransferase
VSSSRERNDRHRGPKQGGARPPWGRAGPPRAPADKDGADWIWGWHAVCAALANPDRERPRRIVATPERARELAGRLEAKAAPEILDAAAIGALLPAGAAHQGVAIKAPPPAPRALDDLAEPAQGLLVMLDQLTDPQNVGAIFRSAAAFGARGVILQERHAPALTGALAKASAGAVDAVPHARATNLSRALERLADLGWRAVGLDGGAAETLAQVLDERPTVLVLGSEGEGLRRLVSEHCDALARIPMPGGFESLNVASAAAIALYEASRHASGSPQA